MIKKLKNKKGFTILESLVAIMVLSLSISGAFTAVTQSLSQSIISKDEVVAFYLAQEAIEVIRNKRDNNQLVKINGGSNTWLDGITSACPFGKICRVDATAAPADKIQLCGAGTNWGDCPYLKQETETDQNPYMYNYTFGNTTNFKREIQIEQVNTDASGPSEIAVTVQVSWTKGLINQNFKVKTLLLNW